MKLTKWLLFLSLYISTLAAQVTIREKVEVKPKQPTLAAQGGGEVEVTLRTSGNIDLVNRKPFMNI